MATPSVMIVEARFYQDIADELVRGAMAALDAAGVRYERFPVPGAFEIPAAIRLGADARIDGRPRFDGFVALGCVIRGETSHYDYVCGESARGLMEMAIHDRLAIGYGILTVEDRTQAMERASVDRRNKGRDAVEACLAMIGMKRDLGC